MPEDINDVQAAFQAFSKEAEETTAAAARVTYDFAELVDCAQEEQVFLVPELLPAHAVAVLIGEDGIGKTQILTQLCLQIATKRDTFLTLPLIAKHGRALIVATEEGRKRFSSALMKQYRFLCPDIKPADVGIKFMEGVSFDEYAPFCAEIEKIIKAQPHDLIVIDALSDLFGLIDGDINNSGHARKIIKVLQKICEDYETTVILIHHVPKTRMQEKRKAIPKQMFLVKDDSQGASAITQLPRTVLGLTHDRSTITANGTSYKNFLHVVKANLMGKFYVTRALELDFDATTLTHNWQQLVNIEEYEKGDFAGAADDASPQHDPATDRKIKEQFVTAIFTGVELLLRPDFIKKLMAQFNVGKNKVEMSGGLISQLLDMKLIEKEGKYFKKAGAAGFQAGPVAEQPPGYWGEDDPGTPPPPPPDPDSVTPF